MIESIKEKEEKERIAREVLFALPEWFGIPESTEEYVRESRELPFFAWKEKDENAGFASLRQTGEGTAEIFVIGVKKEFHGRGIGRSLVKALEEEARHLGCAFLQVKTVRPGRCKEYDATNRFYLAMGFREFECFPTLWSESNPCQVYVKSV